MDNQHNETVKPDGDFELIRQIITNYGPLSWSDLKFLLKIIKNNNKT